MSQAPRKPQQCPTCEEIFTAKRREQVYCSRKCIQTPGKNFPVCPCGTQTESYMQKYCCDDHREQWGRKKAPVRMETHVCQTCEQEFQKPWNYPGKKMFCSVSCSNKQPSHLRIKRYQFGALTAEGGYELRFMACLERLGIEWRQWPSEDFVVYRSDDGRDHEYRPDFIINSELVVEVKGWADDPKRHQRHAYSQWSREMSLVVVDREILREIERIFNREKFLDRLRESS